MTRHEHRLSRQLNEIASLIDRGDGFLQQRVERISRWSISEQLDHLLKVNNAVLGYLLSGKPLLPPGVNLLGRILLLTNYIPRGKGQSPERVWGKPSTAGELNDSLKFVHANFVRWCTRERPTSTKTLLFQHPFFGNLTAKQSIRFLGVHNHHHLKIVRDIRNSSRC